MARANSSDMLPKCTKKVRFGVSLVFSCLVSSCFRYASNYSRTNLRGMEPMTSTTQPFFNIVILQHPFRRNLYGACYLRRLLFPSPDIMYSYIACQWQHMVLAEKAGLCKNLDYSEARKIALGSGNVDISSH